MLGAQHETVNCQKQTIVVWMEQKAQRQKKKKKQINKFIHTVSQQQCDNKR